MTRTRSCQGSARRLCSRLVAALTVAFAAAPAAGQDTAQVPGPVSAAYAQAVDKARDFVQKWMADKHLPGVSVAVGLDGEIAWAEGFGLANLEQGVPVTPLTRFRIGSTSKGLTSAAVGLLHEHGKLDLDAPVRTYVPSFPEKRWPISTRQLMGHTAGIRHYGGDEEVYSSKHYDGVLEELGIFAADSLLFRPGTRSSYSSYGWNLVSAVAEVAAGEPFLDFMRREVFTPLGMTHTVPDDVSAIVAQRTSFYVRDSTAQLHNERYVDESNRWASGGFLSTPSDLVRYGVGLLNGKLLAPQTVKLLWTPVRLESGESTGYGLGGVVAAIRGRPMIASPGSSIGGRTAFIVLPEQRMVIAVMSNVTDAEVAPIWQALLRLFAPADG